MIIKVLVILQASSAWSLKDVSLWAPHAVRVGDSLTLGCSFRLDRERLYSVKFYWADTEFYRYVPGEVPPTRVFPLHGIQVDVTRTNSTAVTLQDVQRELSGVYKCEVSADAPLFHTAIRAAHVTVVEEPWILPVLTAERTKYSLGEVIRANCTSVGGHPLANLTWYLNGRKVSPSTSILSSRETFHMTNDEGPKTSVLKLETAASQDIFQDGRLRLRCVATQFTLYRRSTEIDIYEDTPQSQSALVRGGGESPTELTSLVNKGFSNQPMQRRRVVYLLLLINLFIYKTYCSVVIR